MAKDTLFLRLNGNVPLGLFVKTLEDFSALIKALTEEVVGLNNGIEWEISHLESGSAFTEIRGIIPDALDLEKLDNIINIEKVVLAYAQIGKALEEGQSIPFSEEVTRSALKITEAVNGQIKSVEFGMDQYKALVNEQVANQFHLPKYSVGVITGEVQSIYDAPRLKIALIDPLFKKRVYCYLEPEQTELAREIWGKRVAVTGFIYRDPSTGRPLKIDPVKNVEIIKPAPIMSYKEVRGLFEWHEGDEPAEVSIRRIRDAI